MWLRTLRTWLGRRHGPIQTRKTIRARHSAKLGLEILEERLAPTVSCSFTYSFDANFNIVNTLTMTAANSTSQPVDILPEYVPGIGWFISTSGDVMSFGAAGTPSGFTLTPSGTELYTTNSSNIVAINNLTINAPVTSSNPNGIDTADTVTLFPLSLSDNLTISAKTISFYQPNYVVTASSVSLTSVNSLTFAQTAVPYLGSVMLNAAPPGSQPFSGDPYLTGPDWGSYGYVPGDAITLNGTGTTLDSSGTPRPRHSPSPA